MPGRPYVHFDADPLPGEGRFLCEDARKEDLNLLLTPGDLSCLRSERISSLRLTYVKIAQRLGNLSS